MHRNAKALAWRLMELGSWKGIIAVTRGGLVPAAIVARELNIRLIETACIVSYQDSGSGPSGLYEESQVLKSPVGLAGDGQGWLVIDDLVDTGRTIEVLRKILPKAHYAAVYAKPQGRPLVDTFVTEVSQDTWIYLPWDIELQFAKPLAAQRDN
jgi:xanthine phosphoribosyltransferase